MAAVGGARDALLRCDVCGCELATGDRRFIVKVEVYAPFDGLEVDVAELVKRDFADELDAVTKSLAQLDPEEAQDDVHRAYRYTLCRSCQRTYLRDPLRPAWLATPRSS